MTLGILRVSKSNSNPLPAAFRRSSSKLPPDRFSLSRGDCSETPLLRSASRRFGGGYASDHPKVAELECLISSGFEFIESRRRDLVEAGGEVSSSGSCYFFHGVPMQTVFAYPAIDHVYSEVRDQTISQVPDEELLDFVRMCRRFKKFIDVWPA